MRRAVADLRDGAADFLYADPERAGTADSRTTGVTPRGRSCADESLLPSATAGTVVGAGVRAPYRALRRWAMRVEDEIDSQRAGRPGDEPGPEALEPIGGSAGVANGARSIRCFYRGGSVRDIRLLEMNAFAVRVINDDEAKYQKKGRGRGNQ